MSLATDHVDLFAGGLGGFSWAGRELGYSTLGIEYDADACATREAAGLATLQADVSALDPLDFAPATGVTGGPPCPTYSMAGKGAGRELTAPILAAFTDLADGRDTRDERTQECYAILEPTAHLAVLPSPRKARKRGQHQRSPFYVARRKAREALRASRHADAERSMLVAEPLRWALALRPRWVACEQVPPVLSLWEAMAAALRAHGYWTWTGLISAETMGVPQTRQRAFMLASLDGPVNRPPATHQRYIAPRRRDEATGGLFELPDAGRIVAPEDRGLLPWRSMAEALGWDGRDRVGFPRLNDTPSNRPAAGDDGKYRARDLRPASEPAFAMTEKMRSTVRFTESLGPVPPYCPAPGDGECVKRAKCVGGCLITGEPRKYDPRHYAAIDGGTRDLVFRANAQSNACERGADEPAPTITGGHDHNDRAWVLRSGQSVAGEGRAERPVSEPSLSIISRTDLCSWVMETRDTRPARKAKGAGNIPRPATSPTAALNQTADQNMWVESRPATTVNGDPRISEPGHHDSDVSGSQQANAVRVSLAQALVLQSYSPDYPVQGSKSAAFLQVGNGIPLLLAVAVLRAVTEAQRRDLAA